MCPHVSVFVYPLFVRGFGIKVGCVGFRLRGNLLESYAQSV